MNNKMEYEIQIIKYFIKKFGLNQIIHDLIQNQFIIISNHNKQTHINSIYFFTQSNPT